MTARLNVCIYQSLLNDHRYCLGKVSDCGHHEVVGFVLKQLFVSATESAVAFFRYYVATTFLSTTLCSCKPTCNGIYKSWPHSCTNPLVAPPSQEISIPGGAKLIFSTGNPYLPSPQPVSRGNTHTRARAHTHTRCYAQARIKRLYMMKRRSMLGNLICNWTLTVIPNNSLLTRWLTNHLLNCWFWLYCTFSHSI